LRGDGLELPHRVAHRLQQHRQAEPGRGARATAGLRRYGRNPVEGLADACLHDRTPIRRRLELSADAADGVNRINSDEGVQWLYSFLSADKRKTYCLYEAPSAEAIRRAAARAGLPADVVVEMIATVRPDGSLVPL
jgi:hypothetical protein